MEQRRGDRVRTRLQRGTVAGLRNWRTCGSGDGVTARRKLHRWPFFLPDGRHFLYFARGDTERRGIYLSSLDGREAQASRGIRVQRHLRAGYLLTVRDRALLAYPFDDTQLRITGDPVRVAERVAGSSSQFASFSAVSGVLAYGLGLTTTSQLVWVDRSGKPLGSPVRNGDFVNFRLSPDDARLAVTRVDAETNTADVWLTDLSRGVETRFTLDPMNDTGPVWSPDGQRVLFRSDRRVATICTARPPAAARSTSSFGRQDMTSPTDWSRDGRHLLYHTPGNSSGGYDLFVMPLTGDATPTAVAQTHSPSSMGASRRMAAGSRTNRPNPERWKCTFSHFPQPEAGGPYRPGVAVSHAGGGTEKSCSTSRRIAG